MYFILIDLKSVGIYLRLVCGLYTTLDLVLTKKVICFRSLCNQDSREPDLLRVPCLFVSVSWLLCHCVIFLWMLVSPSVKWQASARCCLKPLLALDLLHRKMVIINFPFSLGLCSAMAVSYVIGQGAILWHLISWKSLLELIFIGVNQRTIRIGFSQTLEVFRLP